MDVAAANGLLSHAFEQACSKTKRTKQGQREKYGSKKKKKKKKRTTKTAKITKG